jgi:subtilase family serine protease
MERVLIINAIIHKPVKTNWLKIVVLAIAGTVCIMPCATAQQILHGHVPEAIARLHLQPIGRLAATNELWLAIGLPLRDRAGLENFVAQVSDPASPNFRHYLTREQLTARFGPTEQDYEAVKNFARTNGLAIAVTHDNRLVLDVTGPAAAVEKAFHITLRTYRHPTEARDFFAPDTEPMVDAAMPVVDIEGLSDFSLPHSKWEKSKGAHATSKKVANGNAPDGSGDLFGNDFRNAYVPGTTLNGAGQSVGLFELSDTIFYTNDIFNYANLAGDGRTNIQVGSVYIPPFNGRQSGSAGELELDIEMAMAIAPNLSSIVCFIGKNNANPNDILNQMLARSNILNLSCSWGWYGPTNTTDAIFMSMDAVGQTFFNASGDSQAFTTGSNSVNGVDNPNVANAPSSNPYITQVGGTTLKMNSAGDSWASEIVWNWAVEQNQPKVGSSGGISSYYSIPSWQTNVSNMAGRGGSTNFRNIPDVAACADYIYEIYNNGNNNSNNPFDDNSGTSAAAPLWAGFMALVNQQLAANGQPSAGFINPALYAIAARTNYTAFFHDVTSGSNTWSASPNLFYATNGYDLCTGLGTMNGTNLINALTVPLTVNLLIPHTVGTNFQFQFLSQVGFTHAVQYGTNLVLGGWQSYTNVTGDGTLKTISIPLSIFGTSREGFVRVLTR